MSDKWISVKDEMPEPETGVLVYKIEHGCGVQRVDRTCLHQGDTPFNGRFWFVGDDHRHRTTHWQPLPAPPEAKS